VAAAIKEARAKSPNVSAIDAGDTLMSSDAKRKGSMQEQNARKAELMADFLQASKPEAVGLGDLDLLAGPAAASGLFEARGMTPIATNVRFKDPAVKTVPFLAWEVGGYRFLAVNLFSSRGVHGIEGATATDPMAALDTALASAGKVDVLLACVHRFDDPQMRRLAERDGPLRIVIDADGESRIKVGSATSRTAFAKPPPRGTELLTAEMYLKRGATTWYRVDRYEGLVRSGGALDPEAAAAAGSSLLDFNSRRLEGSVKGDPGVLQKIEEYKKWSRQALLATAPDNPDAPKYVGAEACAACHQEQAANWKSTVHSHAWDSLVADPDGGAQDPECVSCHTAGFLQPGGTRRIEDTGPFRGVQCENCHAPIAKHPGGAKYPKVNEALCRTCHSETRDPNFSYATYMKFATCTQPHDPAANRVPR
jgi:hypothetical protein